MQIPVGSMALAMPFHEAIMEYFCLAVSGNLGSEGGGAPLSTALPSLSDAANFPNSQPISEDYPSQSDPQKGQHWPRLGSTASICPEKHSANPHTRPPARLATEPEALERQIRRTSQSTLDASRIGSALVFSLLFWHYRRGFRSFLTVAVTAGACFISPPANKIRISLSDSCGRSKLLLINGWSNGWCGWM